jgi:glutathione S-transferase
MVRVYHREFAGRPLRVLWTLEELEEPYELTVMSYEQGTSDEHRARHPLARVPVIEDDEGFVFESAAICMHLADLRPEVGLLPPVGSHERALAYQWACFAPAELEPALIEAAIFRESDPERSAKAQQRFTTAAQAVANAIGERDYLVAGEFGVADVLVGTALSFTSRANIPEALPESLSGYIARLAERPAYQRAKEAASATPAAG